MWQGIFVVFLALNVANAQLGSAPPPPPMGGNMGMGGMMGGMMGGNMCKGMPMFGHLAAMTTSDLWPLRWADWYNSTIMAFMKTTMTGSQWADWMLSSKLQPYMVMSMMEGMMMCGPTPDAMIPSMPLVANLMPTELKIRLTNGSNMMSGRLEVYYNGMWGSVCQDGFGEAEAQVVCNALGYKGTAVVKMNATYGMGTGNVMLSGLKCDARSLHLASCTFNQFGTTNPMCTHSMDVGVMCLADSWTRTRLTGGKMPSEGRVEVFLNGEWGTVCDNGFGWKEAQVVCNGMGYWGKAEMLPAGTFSMTPGMAMERVWLDGVKCYPDMPHLSHCVSNQPGTIMMGCTHDHDVQVRCHNATVNWMCPNGTNMTQTNWMDQPYNIFNQGDKTAMMLMEQMQMKKNIMDMFTPCTNSSMSPPPQPPMSSQGGSNPSMQSSSSMAMMNMWMMLKNTVAELDAMMGSGMSSMPSMPGMPAMSSMPNQPMMSQPMIPPQSDCAMTSFMQCMANMGMSMDMNMMMTMKMMFMNTMGMMGMTMGMGMNMNTMSMSMMDMGMMMMGWTAMQNNTMMMCMQQVLNIQNMPPMCMSSMKAPSLNDGMLPCMNGMTVETILKMMNMMNMMSGMGPGVMSSGGMTMPIMPMMTNPSMPGIWSCNFDTPGGFCNGLMNLPDGQFNWMIGKGNVMTPKTGPSGDHTSSTGMYAYVDVSNRNPGDKARLQVSNVAVPSGGACLQFWYLMYGSEEGTFRINIKCSNGMENSVWEKSGQQSMSQSDWKWAAYSFMNMDTCQLIFEAQVPMGNSKGEGDIAIDDIMITPGSCPSMPMSG